MARIVALVLLALAGIGCGASEAPSTRPGANPLDADWLDGESSIRPEHVSRVLELAQRDPDARALVTEARDKIGKGDARALAQRFTPCPPNITVEGGFTTVGVSDVWMPRTVEDVAQGSTTAGTERKLLELEKAPALSTRRVDHPDFVLLERTLLPEICIAPRLSVAEAYEAVVHELVHALKRDPRAARNLAATAADESAFLEAFAGAPGGEVDAYTQSTRARIRLGHGGKRTRWLLSLFDDKTGALRAPPDKLRALILQPKPQGLGYREGLLRGVFAEARKTQLEQLTAKRRAFETAAAERKTKLDALGKDVDVQNHNIEVHKYNLDLAGAQGDKSLADRSRAGLADAEKAIAANRKLMDAARASQKRLGDEIAALGPQIDALKP